MPLPLVTNTILYVATMASGYICLLMAGLWMSRLLKYNLMDDVFNNENESGYDDWSIPSGTTQSTPETTPSLFSSGMRILPFLSRNGRGMRGPDGAQQRVLVSRGPGR